MVHDAKIICQRIDFKKCQEVVVSYLPLSHIAAQVRRCKKTACFFSLKIIASNFKKLRILVCKNPSISLWQYFSICFKKNVNV